MEVGLGSHSLSHSSPVTNEPHGSVDVKHHEGKTEHQGCIQTLLCVE